MIHKCISTYIQSNTQNDKRYSFVEIFTDIIFNVYNIFQENWDKGMFTTVLHHLSF